MTSIKPYISLIDEIWSLLHQARTQVISHINHTMVMTYRTIGQYIVEYEQWWADRAEYGSGLLQKLADDLTSKFGRGFSRQNIERMRSLYLLRPNSSSVMSISQLSRTHCVRLMSMKDENERSFYTIEASKNNRSIRELNRQFDSGLYLRLALSRDKDWIKALSEQWQLINKPEDVVKDPYVLEFLGLREDHRYSESDLETAIITNLEHFLLELWKWFTFVGRQQRITNWPDHYFVDLVFYHRFLKCFVLIDLKIWRLSHADMWQIMLYVNRYDKNIKQNNENPTIWIVLCGENNKFVVEYALPDENSQIFAKEYQLYLPDKEELKKLLEG